MHATNCCLEKKREIRGVLREEDASAVVCACAKSNATLTALHCVGAGRKKLGVASSLSLARNAGQDRV